MKEKAPWAPFFMISISSGYRLSPRGGLLLLFRSVDEADAGVGADPDL